MVGALSHCIIPTIAGTAATSLAAAALVLETVPARLPGNWPPMLSPSVASDPLMEPGRSTGLPPCLVRASETPTYSTKDYRIAENFRGRKLSRIGGK